MPDDPPAADPGAPVAASGLGAILAALDALDDTLARADCAWGAVSRFADDALLLAHWRRGCGHATLLPGAPILAVGWLVTGGGHCGAAPLQVRLSERALDATATDARIGLDLAHALHLVGARLYRRALGGATSAQVAAQLIAGRVVVSDQLPPSLAACATCPEHALAVERQRLHDEAARRNELVAAGARFIAVLPGGVRVAG